MALLSDHCECGYPMVVDLDDEGLWRPTTTPVHDPARETWEGLAAVLDAHHRAMLCGSCDGSETFDADYHYGPDHYTFGQVH